MTSLKENFLISMGESINKIDSNNKNNKNNKIGNFSPLCEKTKVNTSARTSGPLRVSPLDLISDEELFDSSEDKGVLSSRETRNWQEDISAIAYNDQMDVEYAKMSIFKTKSGGIQLALSYRNSTLYNNKLQTVLFSMTNNKKDFLGNLNSIWGPGTSSLEPYKTLALSLKGGVVDYIGKGRPGQASSKTKIRRAPLFADSVALVKTTNDDHLLVTVQHHGFTCKWFFNNSELDSDVDLRKPMGTKEYRRSEKYGF